MRPFRHRPRARFGAFVAVALLVGAALASPSVALLLAPALVLLTVLATETFPGEQAIARMRARRMRARLRPRRGPRAVGRPRRVEIVRPAGITLAYALAVRPPPSIA